MADVTVDLVPAAVHAIPAGPFIIALTGDQGSFSDEMVDGLIDAVKRASGRDDFIIMRLPEGTGLEVFGELSSDG